jgi:hypothetical protein
LDILTMHLPINVKSPNNITNWQMRFNSAFKGLIIVFKQGVLMSVSVHLCCPHTHFHLHTTVIRREIELNLGTFKASIALSDFGER